MSIGNRTLSQLEFAKVIEFIERNAFTELGKKNISNIKPLASIEDARFEGNLITEAKNIIIEKSLPPFKYLPNIRNELFKTSVEGVVLIPKNILNILDLAENSRNIYQFLKNNTNDNILFERYRDKLFVDKNFEVNIKNILNEDGEVKDSASRELKNIRMAIIEKQEILRKVISKILKKLSDSFLVQEEYTTQREGRIVLPVKAEHKRHVRGFIHSESSTGQTVYIEPEETLALNNEIMSLNFAEKREIEKILRNLTSYIGNHQTKLNETLQAISELDAIFAKAQYSIEIVGAFPDTDEKKAFQIISGKHPLLLKKLGLQKTIPLNLLVDEARIILITGPNAGGKTVVLKTVGLLTLMFMCGLHIPVSPDSNFIWFDKILIDIGDQQSLEDDLSTFSSHLFNLREILNLADSKSLVLLDELGTGTDPYEGSAIAIGILEELNLRKTFVLATTHHSNLKILAANTKGFQNSSMLFDTDKFIPTYIFTQGLPGASYAFEIAKRVGIPENILAKSKLNLASEKTKLEEVLFSLEQKSNELKDKLMKYEIENARLEGLTNLYSNQISKLEKDKKEIIRKAKQEAELLLKEVNSKIENAIKQIRESKADKVVIKVQREEIEKIKESVHNKIVENSPQHITEFQVGDFVKIRDSQTIGEILSISGQKAVLLSGSIKLNAKISHLELTRKPKVNFENYKSQFQTFSDIGLRLDIRGKKPEEAEFEVIKYLDEAYNNLNMVEILHGKGNGVLKKLVHEILKKSDFVKNYYFAKVEFGGEGITIVEFKD